MKRHKMIIGFGVLVLLIIGWYLLRPELLFIDKTVDDKLPSGPETSSAGNPVVLLSGNFHSLAHETKGNAAVHQLIDGRKLLRLTDFETSNGPDVRVYLVAVPDTKDSDTVTNAGFIDLGSMKGNIGDQNYDLPTGVDLNKYRSVSILCARFGVNFGSAPLTQQQS